jgi:hypothetical protein
MKALYEGCVPSLLFRSQQFVGITCGSVWEFLTEICRISLSLHRVLVGKPEGKRSLGRPRRRWDDNINMDLQEVGGGCGDWVELAQDRYRWLALRSTVKNLRVP